jgi:hypothetical protein
MDKNDPNPRSRFKFNLGWDSKEEFQDLVKVNWLSCDPSKEGTACEQSVNSLKSVKEKVII